MIYLRLLLGWLNSCDRIVYCVCQERGDTRRMQKINNESGNTLIRPLFFPEVVHRGRVLMRPRLFFALIQPKPEMISMCIIVLWSSLFPFFIEARILAQSRSG